MLYVGKPEFIAQRYDLWRETENLLLSIRRKGFKSLPEDKLLRLGALYKKTTADLAKARAAEPYGDVTLYLNRLVAETHSVIYVDHAKPWRSFKNFVTSGFPSVIRKHSKVLLIATIMFLLPGLLGYHWMNTDPHWLFSFFPQVSQAIEYISPELESGPSQLASGNISKENMSLFSSVIMVNNIRVSIYAFALGITYGFGTAYMLITNGVMLGAVSYLYFSRGNDYDLYFLAGVLPHGFIELTAIVFSGAAGFLLASALIMPGNLRRIDSLRYHGRQAIRIMYGVVLMLIIAALIEGFITPIKIESIQPTIDYMKIGFAVITAILMIIYFTFAGRSEESA